LHIQKALNFISILGEIEHKAIFNLYGREKGKDILELKLKLFPALFM
jgi:hypothetical protein